MAGHAISAKSEAMELHELSSEELDSVSGGFFSHFISLASKGGTGGGQGDTGGGQNDPSQMFQQIMQQLTQG
ncbi:hypothetical protein CQ14_38740 [Bradyrhizobium lablabi]|uniref:Bacteriocin n=1 Tax=Bradyrhizobium lablabi TaxID=722472 RepID=A0A0R3MHJ7_9BRAD|nr:hypothetical protein [Bradyrhizobium lablabi]KRR19752.1 hypothetical protein CQ14_38740 [Bradyrhizobium lablabi]